MAYSEAQRKAINKYRESKSQVTLLVSNEDKETWTQKAEENGLSLNKWIIQQLNKSV